VDKISSIESLLEVVKDKQVKRQTISPRSKSISNLNDYSPSDFIQHKTKIEKMQELQHYAKNGPSDFKLTSLP